MESRDKPSREQLTASQANDAEDGPRSGVTVSDSGCFDEIEEGSVKKDGTGDVENEETALVRKEKRDESEIIRGKEGIESETCNADKPATQDNEDERDAENNQGYRYGNDNLKKTPEEKDGKEDNEVKRDKKEEIMLEQSEEVVVHDKQSERPAADDDPQSFSDNAVNGAGNEAEDRDGSKPNAGENYDSVGQPASSMDEFVRNVDASSIIDSRKSDEEDSPDVAFGVAVGQESSSKGDNCKMIIPEV